jgi:hypothetical protein
MDIHHSAQALLGFINLRFEEAAGIPIAPAYEPTPAMLELRARRLGDGSKVNHALTAPA